MIKEKNILQNSERINTTSKYNDNTKKDLLNFLKTLWKVNLKKMSIK